ISSLLLLGGSTSHSRFFILLELMENSTCGIKQNTQLAELLQQVKLVKRDEAPMTQWHAFEALEKTLRDILGYTSLKKESYIQTNNGLAGSMRVNEYTDNGDIDTQKQDFNKWVLVVGDD
nr:ATP-dependent DNA helicase PIF1-like [Tanacetum cinerariifolium]